MMIVMMMMRVFVSCEPCALLTYATTENRNNDKKFFPRPPSVCVHAMWKCTFEICSVVAKPSLIHTILVSSIHQFVHNNFPIEIQWKYFCFELLSLKELKLWSNTWHFQGRAVEILANFCLIYHCSVDHQTLGGGGFWRNISKNYISFLCILYVSNSMKRKKLIFPIQ